MTDTYSLSAIAADPMPSARSERTFCSRSVSSTIRTDLAALSRLPAETQEAVAEVATADPAPQPLRTHQFVCQAQTMVWYQRFMPPDAKELGQSRTVRGCWPKWMG
ncbi:hypothetical protein RCF19_34345 [Rhodococcus qingshengii]